VTGGGESPAREEPESTPDIRTVELIATVAHEIRSPLTTIKGFTKTLLDRWDRLDDEMKRDMLQAINSDADRVTRLLTELLDVSRLEAGKLTLHRRPVDLRELAVGTAEDLADRSTEHVVRVVDGSEVIVLGDPDKLRQVVTNFIENALKYTDGGTVTVMCIAEGIWGRLTVSDQGAGIPVRRQADIFEKFTRHEVPGTPSGTGLGLYICKGLIEAHDGRIGLTSHEGKGSTFWFDVPLTEKP
jgi:signal transduction histidine kinase